jgi:hypothetical protein
MSRKKLTRSEYLASRRNRIPLEAQQHGMQIPLPLSAFWCQNPAHEKRVDESWKQPTAIRTHGHRSKRQLDLNPNKTQEPLVDRTIKFKYTEQKGDKK